MSEYNSSDVKSTEKKCDEEICPAIGFQSVNVCVPVEVTPFAKAGNVKVSCFGEPVISKDCKKCKGEKNGSCSFTISQTLCVEVPVCFGANTWIGDTFVCCGSECDDFDCECDCECNSEEEN